MCVCARVGGGRKKEKERVGAKTFWPDFEIRNSILNKMFLTNESKSASLKR